MLKIVCITLIELGIEWQFDNKEMKLKCRTKVEDEKLFEDDKFIEDYIRQEFLKFIIYINKVVKTNPSKSSSSTKKSSPSKKKNGSENSYQN